MLKLVAVWSAPKPEDRDAFETAYANVHAPLARALPNLTSLETILVAEGLEGAPADAYRFAIMTWADKAAMERDEHTPEWLALRTDAGGMIERFGVTLTSSIGNVG
ncbi:EthD family reductase [Novosphingobium sp.]|uniref:EthD family reductase n=1 Tax=Novosphingobium sp. TaxID=1874826 RepID=UPI003BAA177C